MKVFVTGATGYIGSELCKALVQRGDSVHAFYRSKSKIPEKYSDTISFFQGEITNTESILAGMEGCELVFHLAAYASVWARNKDTFRRINYEGTLNVLKAAMDLGVKKIVLCSTAGVFGPSIDAESIDENSVRTIPYFSEYEKWKDKADREIMKSYSSKIHACIVCPTRVFGPGIDSESNAVTKMMTNYLPGNFRFIPGNGQALGNYVFIDDVVSGMLLAMEKGKTGERYILGGENVSYRHFFNTLAKLSCKKHKMILVPAGMIIFLSAILLLGAKVFGLKPKLTPGWARKFLFNWKITSEKAIRNLGYAPVSFEQGVLQTLRSISNSV